jgi:hypothetical protein
VVRRDTKRLIVTKRRMTISIRLEEIKRRKVLKERVTIAKGHNKAVCYQLKEKSGTEDKSAVVMVAAPWCMETGKETVSEIEEVVTIDDYDTLDELM